MADPDAWSRVKVQNKWAEYKDDFNKAQYGKCGYCERKYTGYGDVEHFRPKKQVDVLGNPGRELSTLRVEGRDAASTVAPGYWWLTYSWNNYLFVCNHCNSKWKLNYVSVSPCHGGSDVPRQARVELFHLIHPYDADPSLHIGVRGDGEMFGLTDDGVETIRVLGLNRPSLVESRRDAYRGAVAVVRSYLRGELPVDEVIDLVHPRREFAAARRAGAREVLGAEYDLIMKSLGM